MRLADSNFTRRERRRHIPAIRRRPPTYATDTVRHSVETLSPCEDLELPAACDHVRWGFGWQRAWL